MTAIRIFLTGALLGVMAGGAPFHSAELIFPLEHWHNHSSSIIELPNGDLFVCWFHGSGERQADDVVIQAARWSREKKSWSAPFLLADTPLFPDTNPTLFLDSRKQLWLFWPAIIANQWETALMKYRVSSDYLGAGPPRWSRADNILLIPKNIAERTKEVMGKDVQAEGRLGQHASRMIERAGDKYFSRMGWFTRTHALQLPSGRIVLPMYSDGYSFSLMALSDDGGETWTASEPIVGYGNIQPSVVRKRDGTLVAYMRDNGPPPKRIHISTSSDEGMTWTPARDSELPNPGASVEAIALREGLWAIVYNDTERGRHSLALSLSDDEGATWKWTRHIERDMQEKGAGSFHYPSIIQARDGSIHVTYSYFLNDRPATAARKAIKHARFNIEWVKQGDGVASPTSR